MTLKLPLMAQVLTHLMAYSAHFYNTSSTKMKELGIHKSLKKTACYRLTLNVNPEITSRTMQSARDSAHSK